MRTRSTSACGPWKNLLRLATAAAIFLTAAAAQAIELDCTAVPAGAPAFTVELLAPEIEGLHRGCEVEIVGSVLLDDRRGWDVYLVVDSSGSTAGASGLDLDGDGLVGSGDWRNNSDPGDSVLQAELEAVRRALSAWEGLDVRVSIEEYSAEIPIPPGEPEEQGRIRTVQGLTADFRAVREALDTIASAGSVGATDYGGALLELAAEYDRSGDPARRPVAFFLSDGKPTFPRFPYDATEPQDVDWAWQGANAVAARGLPVNTLEIGTFDDIGVLSQVASLTGGTLLPGLVGQDLLDSIATLGLDGFVYVQMRNESSGDESYAALSPEGAFQGTLALQDGLNELVFRAILRTPDGEWEISCPVSIQAFCPLSTGGAGGLDDTGDLSVPPEETGGGGLNDRPVKEPPSWWVRGRWRPPGWENIDGGPGGGLSGDYQTGGGGGGLDGGGGLGGNGGGLTGGGPEIDWRRRRWLRWPETTDRLSRWEVTPCEGLTGSGPEGCEDALAQLTALSMSLESGELMLDCRISRSLTGHRRVERLIEELEEAIDAGDPADCADVAERASFVTDGSALDERLTGPDPSGPASFDCELLLDDADLDVGVELISPAPGEVIGDGGPCNARLVLDGLSSGRGNTAYDVYFVVDSSGSTAGDSGRDIDGDGTNDSTLEAELEAVRAFVERLDPNLVRVALVEFSAEIPIPPGEPAEQGRIRTVHSLSNDFDAFFASFDQIRGAGSVGATDYGGALLELAAEYDRSADPARGNIAFFLSDGKPTFPRYPYDATEPLDVSHALEGADACASRGIVVNTYEVGVFDDLSTLETVADRTGGRFYPSLAGGAIVDALPGSTLVGISEVRIENLLTGDSAVADLQPDGSWSADIDLVPGENEIAIIVTSDGGTEVVQCMTTFVGDCEYPPCAATPPGTWADEECP